MTVDEDTGHLLLPKTYVTRHGRLVLFADDPLALDLGTIARHKQVNVVPPPIEYL